MTGLNDDADRHWTPSTQTRADEERALQAEAKAFLANEHRIEAAERDLCRAALGWRATRTKSGRTVREALAREDFWRACDRLEKELSR